MRFLASLLLAVSILGQPACKDGKEQHGTASLPVSEHTGVLLAEITFQVDDPEFGTDGPSPYVHLADPSEDIRRMRNPTEVVFPEAKLTLVLDYPVDGEWSFPIEADSSEGFTRAELARKISATYKKMYAEEEQTATIKTIPLENRNGIINRNRTDGKYGIWGHDLEDLDLHTVEISRTPERGAHAYLGIDS